MVCHSRTKKPVSRRLRHFHLYEAEGKAEKEALDPDADHTEDKGYFEIPAEDEPEETGEEDTTEESFYCRHLPPYIIRLDKV